DKLAARGCAFAHSTSKYGENLAAGTAGAMGPQRAVEDWDEERANYDFKKGAFPPHAGHFRHLLWVGSQRLGCGTVACKGKQIWVCSYDPPGNMTGAFGSNVQPDTCKK